MKTIYFFSLLISISSCTIFKKSIHEDFKSESFLIGEVSKEGHSWPSGILSNKNGTWVIGNYIGEFKFNNQIYHSSLWNGFLLKYSQQKKEEWLIPFKKQSGGYVQLANIIENTKNDFIVNCNFNGAFQLKDQIISKTNGFYSSILIKFDSDGNILKLKRIGYENNHTFIYNTVLLTKGEIAISGYFIGKTTIDDKTLMGDPKLSTGFLAILDKDWKLKYSKTFSVNGLATQSFISKSNQLGTIFIENHHYDFGVAKKFDLLKVDNQTNIIWEKKLQISSLGNRRGQLLENKDGSIILSNLFNTQNINVFGKDTLLPNSKVISGGFVLKLSSNGEYLWHKNYYSVFAQGFRFNWAMELFPSNLTKETVEINAMLGHLSIIEKDTIKSTKMRSFASLILSNEDGRLLRKNVYPSMQNLTKLDNLADSYQTPNGNVFFTGTIADEVKFDTDTLRSKGDFDGFIWIKKRKYFWEK